MGDEQRQADRPIVPGRRSLPPLCEDRPPEQPAVVLHASTHHFTVALDRLWEAISDVRQFPAWWPWLRDFDTSDHRLRPGLVMRGHVAPPVPYRMSVVVEIMDVDPLQQVRARVHGDLSGPAVLLLDHTPTGCQLTVCWRIEMCRPAMRVAARVVRPMLVWGHDRVVETTVGRFRNEIGAPDPGVPGPGR